ncbi:coiled-coil domain-containing protein [Thiocapsa bogorovii]|uniref:hypothetical protein n=1 Tax=Thiocapsa bogorovii TaxID=521689 RepID=UPI001E3EFC15|nr:hypothetical protein [Thiocapsa bogorovii]UHD16369.1 hypothetical protein LT988_24530 [Thiocapsa bogorovii]
MNSRLNQLASLLLALYSSGELARLARHYIGESSLHILGGKGGIKRQVRELVEWLDAEGEITETLFDILEENSPERAEDIARVRRALLHADAPDQAEGTNSPEPQAIRPQAIPAEQVWLGPAVEAVSPERAAWRSKLKNVLSAAREQPSEPRDWLNAAAVLPRFDPNRLRPIGGDPEGPATPSDALTALASYCTTLIDGSWTLRLEPRQAAIARLWRDGGLQTALSANPDDSPHRDLLERLAQGAQIGRSDYRDYAHVAAAAELTDWFRDVPARPIDADLAAILLERYRTTQPLSKLLGTHFRGRDDALETLNLHARGQSAQPILGLWGVGGVGKSALLGKFLLELLGEVPQFAASSGAPVLPWVYLDFDDASVDPTRGRNLVEIMARQISWFYVGASSAVAFSGLESISAGDRFSFTPDIDDTSLEGLLRALDQAIRDASWDTPALLLVMDTFERVQARGRSVTGALEQFIAELQRLLPYTRVIVSGRAAIPAAQDNQIQLGDLKPAEADEVLQAMGVDNADLRALILARIGTGPLNLRLAAEAMEVGRLAAEDMEDFSLAALETGIQGQLYTRILGHIDDGAVRRLAHPGLIVRRVTPAIIRHVLAELCDIDPGDAELLFQRLGDHVSLFEHGATAPDEPAALRHRQDVREIMLELMLNDPAWRDRLAEIHDRAIDYYAPRDDAISRAELLYHRLMRDDPPEALDSLWDRELEASLSSSWNEPLPERARAWLGPRIGQLPQDMEALRLADWEVVALRESRELLAMGKPEMVLDTLAARRERLPGSALHWFEAEALRRLGRLDEAMDECRRGIDSTVAAKRFDRAMALHQVAAEISLQRRAWDDVQRHVDQAARMAANIRSDAGLLAAQELQVRARKERGEAHDPDSTLALERTYSQLDDDQLRAAPELSEQVMRTLGAYSKDILRKAAMAFGNRSDQELIKSDAFQLEALLRSVTASAAGQDLLAGLAGQMGLSREKFDLSDLANNAVHGGRLGDTIASVLDVAGDDAQVREQTFSMFRASTAEDEARGAGAANVLL